MCEVYADEPATLHAWGGVDHSSDPAVSASPTRKVGRDTFIESREILRHLGDRFAKGRGDTSGRRICSARGDH